VNEIQAWDMAKIANVACSHRVAEFECASSDDEIRYRNGDSLGSLLRAYARHDFRSGLSDRMDWDLCFEFVEELTPLAATLRRIGTIDAVASSATANAQITIGTSLITLRICLIASGVVSFLRSAATRTLESSTNPRKAGSMGRDVP